MILVLVWFEIYPLIDLMTFTLIFDANNRSEGNMALEDKRYCWAAVVKLSCSFAVWKIIDLPLYFWPFSQAVDPVCSLSRYFYSLRSHLWGQTTIFEVCVTCLPRFRPRAQSHRWTKFELAFFAPLNFEFVIDIVWFISFGASYFRVTIESVEDYQECACLCIYWLRETQEWSFYFVVLSVIHSLVSYKRCPVLSFVSYAT